MGIGNVGLSLFVFSAFSSQSVYILLLRFLEDIGWEVERWMVFNTFSVCQSDHIVIGAIPMEVRYSRGSSSSSTSSLSPMGPGIVSTKMTPTSSLLDLVNCLKSSMVRAKLQREFPINFIPGS